MSTEIVQPSEEPAIASATCIFKAEGHPEILEALSKLMKEVKEPSNEANLELVKLLGTNRAGSGNPISHIFWEHEAAVMARPGVWWINPTTGASHDIVYISTYEARPRHWHINLDRFGVPPGSLVQVVTDVMWMGTYNVDNLFHIYNPSVSANLAAHYRLTGSAFQLWYELRGYRGP